VSVETARPEDFPRIAELTVGVYVDGGLASPRYAPELADVAGRAQRAELLVVRDADGRIIGSVALVLSGDFGNVTVSDEEAAFRMLVVDPAAQGRGIGVLLVTTCLERARAAGKRRMVISTGQEMTAAHRLYERLGFERLPERDWTPEPGVDLLVYALDLGKRTALPPTARRLAGDPAAGPSDGVDGGDQVALLEDLALHHVQLLHDAGPLGEHGDLHLHRLQDDQRVPCGHRRPGLHEDLPDAGDHLRVDLLDRHRASS
jgi:ribosomal protein S18 acetylase RimI-like enzyme